MLSVTAPTNRGRRRPAGSMRDRHYIRHRFLANLALLGFRRRRDHDLRRTFVSLARDGAAQEVLRLVTHAPSSDMLDLYTSVPWERLCGEVARLRVEMRRGVEILALHSQVCCNGLPHPGEDASKVKRLDGGGAGNRRRVRIRIDGRIARKRWRFGDRCWQWRRLWRREKRRCRAGAENT